MVTVAALAAAVSADAQEVSRAWAVVASGVEGKEEKGREESWEGEMPQAYQGAERVKAARKED